MAILVKKNENATGYHHNRRISKSCYENSKAICSNAQLNFQNLVNKWLYRAMICQMRYSIRLRQSLIIINERGLFLA